MFNIRVCPFIYHYKIYRLFFNRARIGLFLGVWKLNKTINIIKGLMPKKEFYIYVREGKIGLETLCSEDIKMLSPAHKEQLKAFLKGVIGMLE